MRSSKHWWLWKEPVVVCENWNVRQATSQQVLKLTTFCTDTCLQSFSPLINCVVHRAVLKFSPCRNKTIPQLVRIALRIGTRYTRSCSMHRRGNLPGWGQHCWLATCQDWWTGAEARLCHEHDGGALSCWKTNMSAAMLRIAGSCFCVSNTSS